MRCVVVVEIHIVGLGVGEGEGDDVEVGVGLGDGVKVGVGIGVGKDVGMGVGEGKEDGLGDGVVAGTGEGTTASASLIYVHQLDGIFCIHHFNQPSPEHPQALQFKVSLTPLLSGLKSLQSLWKLAVLDLSYSNLELGGLWSFPQEPLSAQL